MSKPDLIHPILGPLLWEEDSQWWVGSHRLRVGTEIDLFIEPGDTDRHAILTRAAEQYTWALANERMIHAKAVRDEVLELYNDSWRQPPTRNLVARQLIALLKWKLLVVSDSDEVPVEFTYGAGELFGQHGLAIEVDNELRYSDFDLRG